MLTLDYVKYCIDTDPISLIPSKCNDYIGKFICGAMYQQLFQKNIKGEWILGSDVERLEILNNGLKYIFHLNKEAKWSDGNSLNARNYLQTFYNAVLGNEENFIVEYLNCIVNFEKVRNNILPINELGVKVIDDYILEIELEYSVSYIRPLLGSIYLSPTPIHLDKDSIYRNYNRITNGSYYLKEYLKGKYVLLLPNKYRGNTYNPLLFLIESDLEKSIRLYENNYVDITCDTYFPFENIKKYFKKNSFNMIDSSIIFLLKFNYKNKKEFYDKSIRKALFYSIDKEKISNILYKGITPWNNFVPKCFMINDITRKSLSFSINKAKEYYKRAKSNFNNISLKMIYANFYPNKEIALNIQYYWKSVLNIDLLLEGLSFEEYLYKVENNEFDICLSLLSPTFPSSICFYMNYLNFITEEYEEIYIENLEKFIEYGHVGCSVQENLENILYNELPVLPLFNGKSIYLQRETISGYKLFEDGTTYFKNIKKDRNNI